MKEIDYNNIRVISEDQLTDIIEGTREETAIGILTRILTESKLDSVNSLFEIPSSVLINICQQFGFNPELGDKMVKNIDRALGVKDETI